eukprot:339333-Amphidinium_carterae.1
MGQREASHRVLTAGAGFPTGFASPPNPPPPPPPDPFGGDDHDWRGHRGRRWHGDDGGGGDPGQPGGGPGPPGGGPGRMMLGSWSTQKEAMSIALQPLPTASQFRAWRLGALREVAAASVCPGECFKWILQCDQEDIPDGVLQQMDGFPTIDAKLVSAINRISKGEVQRLLNIRISADTRLGVFTSGRCMLRVLLSYYRTCNEHQSLYSISDILQVRMANATPQGLRSFWTSWRWVEEGLSIDVGEQVKASLLYEQVKDYPPLAAELLPYKLADVGDTCRSYAYLTKVVARHAERELQESTRKLVVAGIRDLAGGQDRAFVTPEENLRARERLEEPIN